METNKKHYREEYTDLEWFTLMKNKGEDLPNNYSDIFDRYGEILEEFDDIMNVNIYISK